MNKFSEVGDVSVRGYSVMGVRSASLNVSSMIILICYFHILPSQNPEQSPETPI